MLHYLVAKFTTEVGKPSKSLAPSALRKLVLYHWPGNVRELENVIERSVALSENRMMEGNEIVLPKPRVAIGVVSFQFQKAMAIAEWEQKYISQLLLSSHGNVSEAARAAGKDRRGLQRLIRRGRPL